MALGPDVEVSLGDPIPLAAHRRQCRDRCDQCFLIMRGRIIRHLLGFLWMVRDETIWPVD